MVKRRAEKSRKIQNCQKVMKPCVRVHSQRQLGLVCPLCKWSLWQSRLPFKLSRRLIWFPLSTSKVAIFTDSLGSLKVIKKAAFQLQPPLPVVEDILTQLQSLQTLQLASNISVTLQKVVAHTGLPGNEQVDALAKAAATKAASISAATEATVE